MTREDARTLYQQKIDSDMPSRLEWLDDPRYWEKSDRKLTPAEFEYAIKALCVGNVNDPD